MKRVVYFLIAVFILSFGISMKVSAGEVSGAESALIAIGQGQYEYDGAYYAFKSEYQTKLYNYLCRDDVDLSQDQVNSYIAQFYGNLGTACTSEYMYKVGDVPKPSNPEPAPSPDPVPPVDPTPTPETPVVPEEPETTEAPKETETSGKNKNKDQKKDKETEPEETIEETMEETTGETEETKPVAVTVSQEPAETESLQKTEETTEGGKDYSNAEHVDNRFKLEALIGIVIAIVVVVMLFIVVRKTSKRKR